MIGPIPPGIDDPWENEFGANNANIQAWRERERRQRTVRLLMMFLLILLLMDGEEQNARRHPDSVRLRKNAKTRNVPKLEKSVFQGRADQEERVVIAIKSHSRRDDLITLNKGRDVDAEVREWADMQRSTSEKSKDTEETAKPKDDASDRAKVYHYPWNATGFYRGEWSRLNVGEGDTSQRPLKDIDDEEKVPVDYKPLQEMEETMKERVASQKEPVGVFLLPPGTKIKPHSKVNTTKLEADQKAKHDAMYDARINAKSKKKPFLWGGLRQQELLVPEDEDEDFDHVMHKLTLTRQSGRAAFQFYSRSIPAMKEISLVEGFVKLYNSNAVGISTRQDVLLRVRGVVIHSIGKLSMVSSSSSKRSALVIAEKENVAENLNGEGRRRRLMSSLSEMSASGASPELEESIRSDALSLYSFDSLEPSENDFSLSSFDEDVSANEQRDSHRGSTSWKFSSLFGRRRLSFVEGSEGEADIVTMLEKKHGTKLEETISKELADLDEARREVEGQEADEKTSLAMNVREVPESTQPKDPGFTKEPLENSKNNASKGTEAPDDASNFFAMFTASTQRSNVERRTEESYVDPPKSKQPLEPVTEEVTPRFNSVFPYPFVHDDKKESIGKAKTQASRRMPQREFLLEANAGLCEFELNFDIQAIQWSVGEWKNLIGKKVLDTAQRDPTNAEGDEEPTDDKSSATPRRQRSTPERKRRLKAERDQALVMGMTGSIYSPNCDLSATLNATAIRTDWEHTTGKAINYSFYMMLTCLTQIVVLLRQLLHTQAQSAATRVSLLCVGWQTVLDALLCLGHISLSLGMQPLFTAFASVAFFKLLIFCVIEMKYMAIIMQARNNSNGGQNTAEVMRRQVTLLHLRFYAALMAVLVAFFYAGEQYRTPYMLSLYSFWVPQIILNIVTEAKRPLHHYYIYGMSISRLVAPLYIFAIPNNFLKEVYPDAPTYPFMCELLVLWIGIQTAVLVAQGRYGARFMIPARFLPPKFDYSRPIPESMLPPGVTPCSPDSSFSEGLEVEVQTLRHSDNPTSDRHSSTTRNRIKGNRGRAGSRIHETTTETTTVTEHCSGGPTLDCVICYNAIDIHNPGGYMLAPCDHIFHRDCLIQWMDVKMECPICRTDLPTL